MSTDRKLAVAALLGLMLSGCGGSAAHQSGARLVAAVNQPKVVQDSPSFCGLTGAGKVAAAPAVGNGDRFWTAVENADNTAHLAAQQLEYGREDLAGGVSKTAAGQFEATVSLLRSAEKTLRAVPAPASFEGVSMQVDRACALSVQAVNQYRMGAATQNSGLIHAANLDLKAANDLLKKVDAELQQLSVGQVAQVQHEAQQEVAKVKVAELAREKAAAERVRQLRLAAIRQAQQEMRRQIRLQKQRLQLQLKLRLKVHMRYAIMVNGHLTYVSKQRFEQWMAYQARMEAAQTAAILSLRKYVLEMNRARLKYTADLRSMRSWIATGDGTWHLVRHQDPVNAAHSTWFYGGNGLTTLLSPYMNRWPEYAVEARIRLAGYVGGNPEDPQGFGLFVRARGPVDLSQNNHGFLAGPLHLNAAPTASPPHAEILAAGITQATTPLQPAGALTSFVPGNGWHTYRLEVRDSEMRLVVDHKWIIAHLTTDADYFNPGVGLFSVNSAVEVSSFKVYRLPPAS